MATAEITSSAKDRHRIPQCDPRTGRCRDVPDAERLRPEESNDRAERSADE
ncbi:hypothetical protein [Aminiphilus sp.]|uniref:hypothetical protein n=1 Tax=Aminiphilus sp. TaxID=1872488 RepID=UPI00260F938E|nr:hypothetical protein [Aminiphilus sp.]